MPDNSDKFDLEHFKVHIVLPEQETYIANGTNMEPEYHRQCSQQGLRAPAVELGWREVTDKAMFTNVSDVLSKTENGPKEYKHVMNGNNVVSHPYSYLILVPSYF